MCMRTLRSSCPSSTLSAITWTGIGAIASSRRRSPNIGSAVASDPIRPFRALFLPWACLFRDRFVASTGNCHVWRKTEAIPQCVLWDLLPSTADPKF
eukprot:11998705-Alexandrium_andersonii.AAC.1